MLIYTKIVLQKAYCHYYPRSWSKWYKGPSLFHKLKMKGVNMKNVSNIRLNSRRTEHLKRACISAYNDCVTELCTVFTWAENTGLFRLKKMDIAEWNHSGRPWVSSYWWNWRFPQCLEIASHKFCQISWFWADICRLRKIC